MKNETQSRCQSVHPTFEPGRVANALLILLLLIAVMALSTLAKEGQYYPRTNPAGRAALSTKMNVAHAPIAISHDDLQPVSRVSPPPPAARVTRLEQFETAPVQKISVTVSMQHRSPPRLLS